MHWRGQPLAHRWSSEGNEQLCSKTCKLLNQIETQSSMIHPMGSCYLHKENLKYKPFVKIYLDCNKNHKKQIQFPTIEKNERWS